MTFDWAEWLNWLGLADIPLIRWGGAGAILLGAVLLRNTLARWLLWPFCSAIARLCRTSRERVDEVVRRPLGLIPLIAGIYGAGVVLQFEGQAQEALILVVRTLAVVSTTWVVTRLIHVLAAASTMLRDAFSAEIVDWGTRAGEMVVWLIGFATVLEVWGVRVAPLIASLGIIGVAVALGAQDFFKNLISGLVVLSERRYRIGDRIQLAGVIDGSVEDIGFRSTRVRLFDGAPVSVPNALLADGALVNYGEIPWRRILWTIGLEYGTSAAQLQRIRDEIEAYLVESGEFVSADEATMEVRVDKFASSSIDIMIYTFANTNEWSAWLQIKERLLFRIKEIVEGVGASFAFPSQSLYVEKLPADGAGS